MVHPENEYRECDRMGRRQAGKRCGVLLGARASIVSLKFAHSAIRKKIKNEWLAEFLSLTAQSAGQKLGGSAENALDPNSSQRCRRPQPLFL